MKRDPGSRSVLLLQRPLPVVRDNLANKSGTTSGTDTGTDGVSDPRLGSLSVLVDGPGPRGGSGNTTVHIPDRLGSSVGLDRCPGGGSDKVVVLVLVLRSSVGLDGRPGWGPGKVGGIVLSNRSDSGWGSTQSLGVLVVSVGSSAGGSLLLSDGSVLRFLLVGGDDRDLWAHVRSGYPVAHPGG